ncbi:MAG TPA: BON domain-containing protein [Candidatus Tectomicrobia bacterium]|jgi:osmotically-inducible protein OsmY
MKKAVLLFSMALLILGRYAAPAYSAEVPRAPAAQTAPDNTGRNVRDRGGATLTPGDQAENAADRTLTRQIRQAIVDDDSLSTTAKNIKIITANGMVTLRGPVKNPQEKSTIEAKAQTIAGADRVDSQLEIMGR